MKLSVTAKEAYYSDAILFISSTKTVFFPVLLCVISVEIASRSC